MFSANWEQWLDIEDNEFKGKKIKNWEIVRRKDILQKYKNINW